MSLDLKLTGCRAVVTGASAGIGAAVARRLASEGVHLYLAARSKGSLEALATELQRAHAVEVTPLALDLKRSDAQLELASAGAGADILVNNAGAIPRGTLEEIDEAAWRSAWDLKVFASINLSRALYPHMRERGRGVILNVIGTSSDKPAASYIAGSMANAALAAFTRALGGDSPRDGIRVVGLSPGPVATERARELLGQMADEEFGDASRFAETLGPLPFGRMATVDEVADLAALLVSQCSAYISGTIVTLDGGLLHRDG
jgi:NAD(P)-dependent dehydrogenase (short-subunit alcohol dehydrogenase family)